MEKCWQHEGCDRPSFTQLVEELDHMLQETAKCTKVRGSESIIVTLSDHGGYYTRVN